MSGLARRAVVLALSRFANYGLMIISPVILVRLLSVGDFGRYREFLLYSTLIQSFAAFSINDSLLYLIPRHPHSLWQIVRQSVFLTFISSALVVGVSFAVDSLTGGALFGPFRLQVSLYVLLFVNIDFWESFFLAEHRPMPVVVYTLGRLVLRMIVVVGVATATRDVDKIIWALVILELIRLILASFIWRKLRGGDSRTPSPEIWREQVQFCVPVGLAVIFSMANRNLGNLAVAKVLGAAALAQYTIGTYGDPIVVALRNSISTVLLPEMVKRNAASSEGRLELWRRTTVVNCILLFPIAVIGWRYAEQLIVHVFGANYRPAAPVMQLYMIVILRECFDFSPALRAVNRTRPLMYSNLLAGLVSVIGLYALMPSFGLSGAMTARIVSGFGDALYLGLSVMLLYKVTLQEMLPWASILKTALAAVGASIVFFTSLWTDLLGLPGIVLASTIYGIAFLLLLKTMNVLEFSLIWNKLTTQFPRLSFGRKEFR